MRFTLIYHVCTLAELYLWRTCIRKEEQRRLSLRKTRVHHDGHTENSPEEMTVDNPCVYLQ